MNNFPSRPSILISLLLVLCTLPAFSQTPKVPVIPTPREFSPASGATRITSQTRIILGRGTTANDRFTADQLNEHLIAAGSPALGVSDEGSRSRATDVVYIGTPVSGRGPAILRGAGLTFEEQMKAEGYILVIDRNGAAILGESERGRYYGMMTLLQLLKKEKKVVLLPTMTIRDWPLMAFRGISDDLSRGQVSTTENFKKIIRYLSRHKLNVYSPYIEDIFVFSNHPRIGKGRGALSPAEVRELDAYAKRHHVELIPIFETLGHWENILLLPEYASYAEFPGAHTVNVTDERVYALLDEMIGEIASAFSSPYFNMAADESWDVGLGASKEVVAKSDLATVHADHYRRLFDILKKHGKKPLMYGDIILNHPSILEKIPRDVIIVDWQYWAGREYPSAATFRSAGFPFIVSPAIWNFTGPFPNYLNTVINVRNFAGEGYRNNALGLLTSNWNDYGGEAFRELNYYGFAWTAECAWQPLRADQVRFEDIFFSSFFGDEEAGRLVRAAYHLLSNVYTHLEWHEIWRHPMLPIRGSILNNLWRFQAMEASMPVVQNLIARAKTSARENVDHFAFLGFVTRLNAWFPTKVRAHEAIRAHQADSTRPFSERADNIRAICTEVIAGLESLKKEFAELWLATNRKENLHLLLARYDRQISYWQEVMDDPMMGDPSIPSAWLYHPKAQPHVRDSAAVRVPKAFFRMSFDRDGPDAPGGIQLLADTYGAVMMNGHEIGSVFARRSLSLTVEQERAKRWDLSPYLRPGRNVIAIEAANYDALGSAGINVLGYRASPGGTMRTVVLDSLVRVSDTWQDGWMNADFDDSRWVSASAKPVPYVVVAPDFKRGRLSWIER